MAAAAGSEGYLSWQRRILESDQGARYKTPPAAFEDGVTDRDLPVTAGAFEIKHCFINTRDA